MVARTRQRALMRASSRPRQHRIWGPVASAVLSFLAATQALSLWNWRPGTPMQLGGDATGLTSQLRQIMDHGRLTENQQVGAPFGQNPGWFPVDDQLHFLVVRLIGVFADSPFTAGSVYFVLGFPLSALTAYWLMREVGTSRMGAVVGSVLFSVLPGHQLRYEHLWLASYWVLPLGVWLVLRVGRGEPLWQRPRGPMRSTPFTGDLAFSLRTALIVVCVATGGVYYLAFTLLLLGAVMVVRVAGGERGRLVGAAAVAAGMVGVAGGAIAFSSQGRADDVVTGPPPGQRSPGESEFFAGKLMDLVLPWYEHRAGPMRFLTTAYNAGTDATVEHPALGLVALTGVVALLWLAFVGLVRSAVRLPRTLSLVAALTVLCLALYTKGGLGSFIALFGTPQLRTWSRLYVLIGLFGLIAVAWWLSVVQRRVRRPVAASVAVVVLGFGVLDQTNPEVAPNYAAMRDRIAQTKAFTDKLESAVPRGCPVFQLPIVEYPESLPAGDMKDYDHLMPSLTSSSLRWSYGAMRGTQRADWQLALPTDDAAALSEAVAAAGFCAIEVDTAGYSSNTSPVFDLTAALGTPVAQTADGRLIAFSLRATRDSLLASLGETGMTARADQVLHPVVARVGGYPPEEDDGMLVRWIGGRSAITVGNLTGDVVRDARLTIEFAQPAKTSWDVTVAAPGAATEVASVPGEGTTTVTMVLDLPPGALQVLISSDVDNTRLLADGRTVSGQIRAVTITASHDVIAAVAR